MGWFKRHWFLVVYIKISTIKLIKNLAIVIMVGGFFVIPFHYQMLF